MTGCKGKHFRMVGMVTGHFYACVCSTDWGARSAAQHSVFMVWLVRTSEEESLKRHPRHPRNILSTSSQSSPKRYWIARILAPLKIVMLGIKLAI